MAWWVVFECDLYAEIMGLRNDDEVGPKVKNNNNNNNSAN